MSIIDFTKVFITFVYNNHLVEREILSFIKSHIHAADLCHVIQSGGLPAAPAAAVIAATVIAAAITITTTIVAVVATAVFLPHGHPPGCRQG